MGSDDRTLVIGFVGSSGAGKTTLLEHVIAALESRGLSVGVVKHASHGFAADRPGKDSYRLYGAGARAVALVSRDEMALFQRRAAASERSEPELDDALAALPPDLDAVLVEGFAWAPIPRFVVVKGREAPRREHLQRGAVIRIVRTRDPVDGEPFMLPPAVGESVVRDVLSCLRRHAWGVRAAEEIRGEAHGMTAVISPDTRSVEHPAGGG